MSVNKDISITLDPENNLSLTNNLESLVDQCQVSRDSLRSIDFSLSELVFEARVLFQLLDHISSEIKKVDAALSLLNANFPFKQLIHESRTPCLDPQENHKAVYRGADSFYHSTETYLAWNEIEENSKKFRLILLVVKKEFVLVSNSYSPTCQTILFDTKFISRKPLTDTDLPTRLKAFKKLGGFIKAFAEYLANSRREIESSMRESIPSF